MERISRALAVLIAFCVILSGMLAVAKLCGGIGWQWAGVIIPIWLYCPVITICYLVARIIARKMEAKS